MRHSVSALGSLSAAILAMICLASTASAQLLGSSGLLSDVGNVVDDVLDLPGEIIEGVIGSPGGGGGGGGGGAGNAPGVLEHNQAILAVQQQQAMPLDALMAIVAQHTTSPVIDVQLILVQNALLLYEVKTLDAGGLVTTLYFHAVTGALVQF